MSTPLVRSLVSCAALATAASCADTVEVRQEGDVRVTAIRQSFNNSFLVEQGGGRLLIDAGLERHAGGLERALQDAGVDLGVVDALVITHGHADHAGGAAPLRAAHGLPIVVGAADEGMLADGGRDRLCPTDALAESRLEGDASERYVPFEPDVRARERADLAGLSAVDASLVFVPSHTDGSLSVVVGPFAFVGDLLRGDILSATAAPHFYMCDLEANRRDIERLLAEHPEVTTIFPGHFGPLARAEVEALLERWPTP